MKAYFMNMHLLVPRSRSSAKVKVKYKGYISQKMSVSGAFVFHIHILFEILLWNHWSEFWLGALVRCKIIFSETTGWISTKFGRNVPWLTLFKNGLWNFESQKKRGCNGQILFSLCEEIFWKSILKLRGNFNQIWVNLSQGSPLKNKNMAVVGTIYFLSCWKQISVS